MNAQVKQRGLADAQKARAELYDTLSQLKVRLNYAQRVDDAIADTKLRIIDEKRRNPVGFAIGALGVAATVGVTVWGIANAVAKRLS